MPECIHTKKLEVQEAEIRSGWIDTILHFNDVFYHVVTVLLLSCLALLCCVCFLILHRDEILQQLVQFWVVEGGGCREKSTFACKINCFCTYTMILRVLSKKLFITLVIFKYNKSTESGRNLKLT